MYELLIYEDIGGAFGGITPRDVAAQLASVPKGEDLVVRINSAGGCVFDGMTIYQALRRRQGITHVEVDGAACSIASVIAMAASPGKLRMADTALMMVHGPWALAVGGADELRRKADLLDKVRDDIVGVYAGRSKRDRQEFERMMVGDSETWLDANEALAAGLADELTGSQRLAAHVRADWIKHPPLHLVQQQRQAAAAARARLDKINQNA